MISFDIRTANIHWQLVIYSGAYLNFPFPPVIAVIQRGYFFRHFRLMSTVHLFKFVIDANLDNSSIKVLQQ